MNQEVISHLNLSYETLQSLNLTAKKNALQRQDPTKLQAYYLDYLENEPSIKAITLCFTDLEGRFHMLDYDKTYFMKSFDRLTLDGSSVQGFSLMNQSDLAISPDWSSFRWVPADVFCSGKILMFGLIQNQDGSPYASDLRHQLKAYLETLYQTKKITTNLAVECEGFLFEGKQVEQQYHQLRKFTMLSKGGYFNALPQDALRQFIDKFSEAQRAMAFENEKDHPEVAPSQFELNYKYTDALIAADQVQLYKLMARQIANQQGATASFLPKPIAYVNGNGMHCNLSLSQAGNNLFYDETGEQGLSEMAWNFIDRTLYNAHDLCLILNSSVNAYRRLDPKFEAPNQIKSSSMDRTSMIRIPLADKQAARIEIRTVAPDSNPYAVFLALLKIGLEGPLDKQTITENRKTRTRVLPNNIYDAMRLFKSSELMESVLGKAAKDKYYACKMAAANRCPKELGNNIKASEIIFHHEVTNQYLWSNF